MFRSKRRSGCVWREHHIAFVGIIVLVLLWYAAIHDPVVVTLPQGSRNVYNSQVHFSSSTGMTLHYEDEHSGKQIRSFYLGAPSKLVKNETCQPRKLSFLTNKPRYRTALLSFPGSGNTWVRHLIQELTGYYTGSVYNDKNLAENGFPGESVPVSHSSRHCIVYKSHQATAKTMKPFSKALIIIRNPLHAIKAYFNFEFSSKKQSEQRKQHVHHADPFLFHTTKWRSYLNERLKRWRMRNIFWLKKFKENCTIVLYESLKSNCSSELLRIGRFLEIHVKPTDVWCTIVNKEGQFHRPAMNKTSSSVISLFTPKQEEEILRSICEVSNVARKLGIDLDISQYLLNVSETNDTVC